MILINFLVLLCSFFLRKYAWAVELDERIVLDAYDSGSMITYEEVDVDEEDLSGRRRSNKKKTSYLPLFYFVLFALSILILSLTMFGTTSKLSQVLLQLIIVL